MSGENRKILAIDDSLTVRKLVGLILGNEGYHVELAESGQQGLDKVQEIKPDLILLDYVLPDLPSPEICQRLLKDPATSRIPVLMISSNGQAIRGLYQDSPNVKDYLTKPFQSKVLTSVVKNLFDKAEKEAAEPVKEAAPVIEELAEAPAPESMAPKADTISDTHPHVPVQPPAASPAKAAPAEKAPEPAQALAPSRAPTPAASEPAPAAKKVASAAPTDTSARIRGLLAARMRAVAKHLPALEQRRGKEPPETYYLKFLVRQELVSDLVGEIAKSGGARREAHPIIAGTDDFKPADAALLHLADRNEMGYLRIDLSGEVVEIFVEGHRIHGVFSNNARNYCVGSSFNFRAVPKNILAQAVGAQKQSGVPLFFPLLRQKQISERDLAAQLDERSRATISRALGGTGIRYQFFSLEKFPEPVRQHPVSLRVRQSLLDYYRTVDDWLTIESVVNNQDACLTKTLLFDEFSKDLTLNDHEKQLLNQCDGSTSVQNIIAWSEMSHFDASQVLFRLLRLNLVEYTNAPTEFLENLDEPLADETWLNEPES